MKIKNMKKLVKMALEEDIGEGDVTSKLCIPKGKICHAKLIAKGEGIICGLDIIETVFSFFRTRIVVKKYFEDGNRVKKGDIVAEMRGDARSIFSAERVILNFLQRLSGIATLSGIYANKVKGYKTRILDTRKTTPGMRELEKYAVRCGGCTNHRHGLYDMVLIKDNHVDVCGSIQRTVKLAKKSKLNIEVECLNLSEVKEALDSDCDWIMLDNMPVKDMKKAIEMIDGKKVVEISGGVTLKNVLSLAKLGADYISVGAITHSAPSLDLSMKVDL